MVLWLSVRPPSFGKSTLGQTLRHQGTHYLLKLKEEMLSHLLHVHRILLAIFPMGNVAFLLYSYIKTYLQHWFLLSCLIMFPVGFFLISRISQTIFMGQKCLSIINVIHTSDAA